MTTAVCIPCTNCQATLSLTVSIMFSGCVWVVKGLINISLGHPSQSVVVFWWFRG